jgi:hypothetical protein
MGGMRRSDVVNVGGLQLFYFHSHSPHQAICFRRGPFICVSVERFER